MIRRGALVVAIAAVIAMPFPAHGTGYAVQMYDDYFDDSYRVIRVGDRITWTNSGGKEHTVTSFPDSPKRFSSGDSNNCVPNPIIGNDPDDCMDPGKSFGPIRFDTPGVYEYYCRVHGTSARRPEPSSSNGSQPCRMCGRIDVRAASTTSPGTGKTTGPAPTRSPSPSKSASASPSPSRSPGGPTISPSPSPVSSSGGGLGRGSIALTGIMVLSAAAWVTWRRYFAQR